MQCNVGLSFRKLLSAHKRHVRETSLFTDPIVGLYQVCTSQTSRFGARSKSGKVKRRRLNISTLNPTHVRPLVVITAKLTIGQKSLQKLLPWRRSEPQLFG